MPERRRVLVGRIGPTNPETGRRPTHIMTTLPHPDTARPAGRKK